MRALIAILALGGGVCAQQSPPSSDSTVRMKDPPRLSDEQVMRFKEIFTKEREERHKQDEARTAEMNEILRAERGVESLKLENADEWAAIQDLVGKILKSQGELMSISRSISKRLSGISKDMDLNDAAVESRIKELREERPGDEKMWSAFQNQLTDVVSNRQRVGLILQRILK